MKERMLEAVSARVKEDGVWASLTRWRRADSSERVNEGGGVEGVEGGGV